MLLIEEMLKSRNVTYWLVTTAMSCNYTVSFGINRAFWFRFNFVLLYLAIIFMLTGMVPADEQDWVFTERDGREVGCVPRSGADAVLNIGSAFHGEELGGGRGTPENQTKAQFDDRCFIQHKHIVLNMRSTSKSAYFSPCTYEEVLWRTQTSHRL